MKDGAKRRRGPKGGQGFALGRALGRACGGRPVAAGLALAAMLVVSGPAGAVSRLTFSGVVDSLSAGYAIPGVAVGDAVSGSLLFDPTVADGQPLNWMGYYPGAITGFSATLGSQHYTQYTAQAPNSEIDVINDEFVLGLYRDTLLFRVAVVEAATPDLPRFFQLTFGNSTATPSSSLTSDDVPANWAAGSFALQRGFITVLPPGASQGNNFVLNAVEVAPVPEPRMSLLMLAGLSLLWLGARLSERRRAPAR